jgi:hypothetical protein
MIRRKSTRFVQGKVHNRVRGSVRLAISINKGHEGVPSAPPFRGADYVSGHVVGVLDYFVAIATAERFQVAVVAPWLRRS